MCFNPWLMYLLTTYVVWRERSETNLKKHYQLFKPLYFELALAKMKFVIPVSFSYFCLEKPQHAVREKSKGKISIQQLYSRSLTCFWFFLFVLVVFFFSLGSFLLNFWLFALCGLLIGLSGTRIKAWNKSLVQCKVGTFACLPHSCCWPEKDLQVYGMRK